MNPPRQVVLLKNFVDAHLSNWYVRFCRRRFWKGEYEHDKICAYQTLYECLETITRLMAPVAPFFADWLFKNLNAVTERFNDASVHHTDFPKADETVIDTDLGRKNAIGTGYFFFDIIAAQKSKY